MRKISSKDHPRNEKKIIYILLTGLARSGTTIITDIFNESKEMVVFSEYPIDELVEKVDGIFEYDRRLKGYTKTLEQTYAESLTRNPSSYCVDLELLAAPEPPGDDVVSLRPSGRESINQEAVAFRSERAATARLNHPERTPSEELLKPILNQVFLNASKKKSARVFGCKTPNLFDIPRISYVQDKLGEFKIFVMMRNPVNVVNSSIERRNNALKGLDIWPIRDIDAECIEVLRLVVQMRAVLEHFKDRIFLIKYEDIQEHGREIGKKICKFLHLNHPIDMNMFTSLPEKLHRFSLSEEEEERCQHWLGHIDRIWSSIDLTGPLNAGHLRTLSTFSPVIGWDEEYLMSLMDNRRFLLDGWSITEPWGVWSDQEAPALVFCSSDEKGPSSVTLTLQVSPWRCPGFAVRIYCNGSDLGGMVFSHCDVFELVKSEDEVPLGPIPNWHQASLVLPLHYEIVHGVKCCRLDFKILDLISPIQMGYSEEDRKLGIGLVKISTKSAG